MKKFNLLDIRQASKDDAQIIHKLAHQIYYPTYSGILSEGQIDFMLQKSYSEDALKQSILTDQDFYLVLENNIPVGFIAFKEKDESILRIEKLYLLPQTQGKGFGKFLIDFAKSKAKSIDKFIVELNVNRGNKAYYFYLKMGFEVVQKVDIPYHGYVLDDYVMQLKVSK